MTLIIRKQNYPTHTGERPLSYAIYLKRRWRNVFLAYSWSIEGATRAVQELSK